MIQCWPFWEERAQEGNGTSCRLSAQQLKGAKVTIVIPGAPAHDDFKRVNGWIFHAVESKTNHKNEPEDEV